MSKLDEHLLSLPWTWWKPGDPEDRLLGFCTRAERDAAGRGEQGPFRRRVRGLDDPEPSFEAKVTRAYLDGDLKKFVEITEAQRDE